MLNVSFSDAPTASVKEKKHKKDKKKSKKSKHSKQKKEKHREASESDEDDSGSEDIAPHDVDQKPPPQRDEWMTLERNILEPSAGEKDALDRKQQEQAKKHAEPVMVPGLRIMKPREGDVAEKGPKGEADPATISTAVEGRGGGEGAPVEDKSGQARPAVGDGGMSWRMRAQMRAMGVQPPPMMTQQAARGGSSGQDPRRDRPPPPPPHHSSSSRPHYLNNLHSDRCQMRKPGSFDGSMRRGGETREDRRGGPPPSSSSREAGPSREAGQPPLNAFSSDGSFLDKFSSMREKQGFKQADDDGRPKIPPPSPPDNPDHPDEEANDPSHHPSDAQPKLQPKLQPPPQSQPHPHPAPQPQEPLAPVTNKSIADILRAKLKGLPTPDLPPRNTAPPIPPSTTNSHVPASSDRPQRDFKINKEFSKKLDKNGDRRKEGDEGRGRREGEGEGDSSDDDGQDDEGIKGRRTKRKKWEDQVDEDDEEDDNDDENDDEHQGRGRKREVVHLPLVDAQGRAVRGAFGREAAGHHDSDVAHPGGKKPRMTQRYDKEGKKQRYFEDDDSVDLATLVKRTKYGDDDGARGVDDAFARNVMSKPRFKEKDMDVDDEYDHDGGLELYESKHKRGGREEQQRREKERQIALHSRSTKLEDRCVYCPSSSRRPRHLTVSIAQSAYLMLPDKGRLSPHHCLIVAADHSPCMRQVDDHAWTEIKNYIKCLIQMFASKGMQCIFLETAMNVKSMKGHAVLECIPVSQRELDKAPAYFKKGMQEAESEWSTHHSKAVIETTAKKGLRESVPPGFPYLYVQFGYGSGMLHVIDDEEKYDVNLGRQILQGVMGARAEDMNRVTKGESITAQERLVEEFKSLWTDFDWTRELE